MLCDDNRSFALSGRFDFDDVEFLADDVVYVAFAHSAFHPLDGNDISQSPFLARQGASRTIPDALALQMTAFAFKRSFFLFYKMGYYRGDHQSDGRNDDNIFKPLHRSSDSGSGFLVAFDNQDGCGDDTTDKSEGDKQSAPPNYFI